jgi:aquaporin Z
LNKLAAELLGTFALVFAGCGAIVANNVSGGAVTHVGISLVFGLVVMALAYSLGEISGAHLNPAVTIGFAAARRFSWWQVLPYVLTQCAGALAAAALLRLLYPTAHSVGHTLPAGEAWQSFVLEIVLTWLLMFVILRVSTGAKEKGIMAGAAVGATVALDALFGGPISGASMNPARSLGPALVVGDVDELWIYIAAPLIGALLAVLSEWLVCPATQPCPPGDSSKPEA